MTEAPLSAQTFSERLARLCIQGGPWDLPKALQDRHILLKSMQLQFDSQTTYSEPQVNERLADWMREVAPSLVSDVANLRRNLVDYKYLSRDAEGRAYRVVKEAFSFAPEVDRLNPAAILHAARASREQRRREQAGHAGKEPS